LPNILESSIAQGDYCHVAQVTIYLDEATHRKMEAAAKRESVSMSRWAREHLAKAAEESAGMAWDHLRAFSGSAGEDFTPPGRAGESRHVPDLE
jgi:hypothetical protein